MGEDAIEIERIRRLLAPRTIAVIGASQDPTRIGGRPIAYSMAAGFSGAIFPVNPKYSHIQGLRAYPSLESLPGVIDLAIVAVSQDRVERVIEEGAGKVGGYVLFSAGYKEIGPDGLKAEERLQRLVDQSGSVLLGPNCLGYINVLDGVYATFSTGFESVVADRSGGVAIVTQSGAFGAYLLRLASIRHISASYWVSTGNEAGLTVADLIWYYAHDPRTQVILAYLEGVKDGERLRRALRAVDQQEKTLIVVKVGKTTTGAKAAQSHTGSFVGSDDAFDAALRGHRTVRATSVREMLELAEAVSIGAIPSGRRLGIITVSGGAGILMADAALAQGLDLPEMPNSVQKSILEQVPFASPINPVDITAQMINKPDLFRTSLMDMVRECELDVVVVFLSHMIAAPSLEARLMDTFRAVREGSDVPLYVVGIASPQASRQLRALRVMLIEDPAAAISLIATLAELGQAWPTAELETESEPVSGCPRSLLEFDVKHWLAQRGLKVPRGFLIKSPEEAAQSAEQVGYPVALKLSVPGLHHKTDVGGVRLGLMSPQHVRQASQELLQMARENRYADPALLVEEMSPEGPELLVSVKRDPVFGPLIIFGLGGVLTEVFRDVRTELATAPVELIAKSLGKLQSASLLAGLRGQKGYALYTVAEWLAQLAHVARGLIQTGPFLELELNPVRVTTSGLWILDAVLYPREDDGVW